MARVRSVDELVALPGVAAVGVFNRDGTLVDFTVTERLAATADTTVPMAVSIAEYCASISLLFGTLARVLSRASRTDWLPQRGWLYSGGDWTIGVAEPYAVIVETAATDFARLTEALLGVS